MGVVKPARRTVPQVGKPAPVTPPQEADDPVPGMMPRSRPRRRDQPGHSHYHQRRYPPYPTAELTARRPRRRCRDLGAARRRVHHGEWGCVLRPRGLPRSS